MTYTPKHRAEPVTKYRVHYFESEIGWGASRYTVDYDTPQLAQAAYDLTNAQNTAPVAPDYYVKATKIERVVL